MKEGPPASHLVLFFSLAVAGCAWDLISKEWAFRSLGPPDPLHTRPHWVIPGIFALTTNLNEGALFGMGQGYNVVFAAFSVVAIGVILYWMWCGGARKRLNCVALGLVMAGAIGNLYDRLGLHGLQQQRIDGFHRVYLPGTASNGEDLTPVYAVRDFLDFRLIGWPIFNFADSFLVVGAGLLVLQSLWRPKPLPAGVTAQNPDPPSLSKSALQPRSP